MKFITRIRLINWQYFIDTEDDIIFGKQTIITGANGTGKSTIIDALQTLFVANQKKIKYNAAALDKSERRLLGYLKGETGVKDKPYLRDASTSYIMSEFWDDVEKKNFVIGAVFDAREDGAINRYSLISKDNVKIKDMAFYKTEKILYSAGEFAEMNKDKSDKVFKDEQGEYQKALRSKFGNIHDRFFQLFVKSIAFKPMYKVKDWIVEHLLEKKKLDLGNFRNNIEHYKEIAVTLDLLEKEKEELFEICRLHQEYMKHHGYVLNYEYAQNKFYTELKQSESKYQETKIQDLKTTCQTVNEKIIELAKKTDVAEKEVELAQSNLSNHAGHQKQIQLQKEIRDNETAVETNAKEWNRLQSDLALKSKNLKELLQYIKEGTVPIENDQIGELLSWYDELGNDYSQEDINRLKSQGEDCRNTITKNKEKIIGTIIFLQNQIKELERKSNEVQDVIKELQRNRRSYDPSVTKLKQLLEEKLGSNSVYILCEEMEILAEEWTNAIEGYLNTQRFDLLVSPENAGKAITIYEQEKHKHRIERVGLVDTEKEQKYLGRCEQNSLAQIIECSNPIIKARVCHLLGAVIQAENEQDMRNYKSAITQTCMSYHGLVAKQISSDNYKTPYIGQRSLAKQLVLKQAELNAITQEIDHKNCEKEFWVKINEALKMQERNIEQWLHKMEVHIIIKQAKRKIADCEKELHQLDQGEIQYLNKALNNAKEKRNSLLKEKETLIDELSRQKTILEAEDRQHDRTGQEVKKSLIQLELWYQTHSSTESNAAEKAWEEYKNKNRNISNEDMKVRIENNLRDHGNDRLKNYNELIFKRKEFGAAYGPTENVNDDNNTFYEQKLNEITTDIPKRKAEIESASKKAYDEFKASFILNMREALNAATDEFNRLNIAIKDFPFGVNEEKYSFGRL